jgi:DNA-binding NtrC family response regulator
MFRILVADDDSSIIAPFLGTTLLASDGFEIVEAESPERCLEVVGEDIPLDIILLDIQFGSDQTSGLDLIPMIRKIRHDVRIVMISGNDDDATLLRALAAGANDFISKRMDRLSGVPSYIKSLKLQLRNNDRDEAEADAIAAKVGASYLSPLMRDVFVKVVRARRNQDLPVLITGETGVGKELVARAVNIGLGRPRVDVDCGAIPESLVESEFFGHEKGSFTGATANKDGKFVQANGGDLFLDEIGNLRRPIQDRFLRAIQLKEVVPIGSSHPKKADARIIAATNENLEAMVASNSFRGDLLERLKGVWIEIPPLRNRVEDIDLIVQKVIEKSTRPNLSVSSTCLAVMKTYDWPGNVRELELVVREMIAQCSAGNQLSIMHLPERIRRRLSEFFEVDGFDSVIQENRKAALPDSRSDHGQNGQYSLPLDAEWNEVVDSLMRQYLPERFRLLGRGANRSELARSLGLARNTLSAHLKRLELDVDAHDDERNDASV